MRYEELEVGEVYYDNDANQYTQIIHKTDNYGVVIKVESAHYFGYLEFINPYDNNGNINFTKVDDSDKSYYNMLFNQELMYNDCDSLKY